MPTFGTGSRISILKRESGELQKFIKNHKATALHVKSNSRYDKAAFSVRILTTIGDYSILPDLKSLKEELEIDAKNEDTSHGGFTLWQVYCDFIAAVDDMQSET